MSSRPTPQPVPTLAERAKDVQARLRACMTTGCSYSPDAIRDAIAVIGDLAEALNDAEARRDELLDNWSM